jgi:hypothetical protein
LSGLFEELDRGYTLSAKRSCFEAQLPYSEEKYRLFHHILPAEKFKPLAE